MSQTAPQYYRIVVKGSLHPNWSDWLNGMAIEASKETADQQITILTGVVKDQAALRGLLNRLWDVNYHLISLQQIHPLEGRQNPTSTEQTDNLPQG